jgi:hypothetical protein
VEIQSAGHFVEHVFLSLAIDGIHASTGRRKWADYGNRVVFLKREELGVGPAVPGFAQASGSTLLASPRKGSGLSDMKACS